MDIDIPVIFTRSIAKKDKSKKVAWYGFGFISFLRR
jgi:hypothetical protein